MSAPSPSSGPVDRFNTSALTEPLDDPRLGAFIADSKATGKPWRQITTGLPNPGLSDLIGQLVPAAVPLAGLIFFLVIGGSSLVRAVWCGRPRIARGR